MLLIDPLKADYVIWLSSSSLLLQILSEADDKTNSLILSTIGNCLPLSRARTAVVCILWRKMNFYKSISWPKYDWLYFMSFLYYLSRLFFSLKWGQQRILKSQLWRKVIGSINFMLSVSCLIILAYEISSFSSLNYYGAKSSTVDEELRILCDSLLLEEPFSSFSSVRADMRNNWTKRKLFKLKLVYGAMKSYASSKIASVRPPISLIQVRKS